jgi:hypothetical protein
MAHTEGNSNRLLVKEKLNGLLTGEFKTYVNLRHLKGKNRTLRISRLNCLYSCKECKKNWSSYHGSIVVDLRPALKKESVDNSETTKSSVKYRFRQKCHGCPSWIVPYCVTVESLKIGVCNAIKRVLQRNYRVPPQRSPVLRATAVNVRLVTDVPTKINSFAKGINTKEGKGGEIKDDQTFPATAFRINKSDEWILYHSEEATPHKTVVRMVRIRLTQNSDSSAKISKVGSRIYYLEDDAFQQGNIEDYWRKKRDKTQLQACNVKVKPLRHCMKDCGACKSLKRLCFSNGDPDYTAIYSGQVNSDSNIREIVEKLSPPRVDVFFIKSLEDVLENVLKEEKDILLKHFFLGGSRGRGTHSKGSDFDFTMEIDHLKYKQILNPNQTEELENIFSKIEESLKEEFPDSTFQRGKRRLKIENLQDVSIDLLFCGDSNLIRKEYKTQRKILKRGKVASKEVIEMFEDHAPCFAIETQNAISFRMFHDCTDFSMSKECARDMHMLFCDVVRIVKFLREIDLTDEEIPSFSWLLEVITLHKFWNICKKKNAEYGQTFWKQNDNSIYSQYDEIIHQCVYFYYRQFGELKKQNLDMWKTNPNMKIPHCYDGDKAFIGKAAVCVTDPLQPWRNLTRPFQKKENLRKVLKIKEIFSSKLKEFENDRDEFFRKLSAHLNENNEERKINENRQVNEKYGSSNPGPLQAPETKGDFRGEEAKGECSGGEETRDDGTTEEQEEEKRGEEYEERLSEDDVLQLEEEDVSSKKEWAYFTR